MPRDDQLLADGRAAFEGSDWPAAFAAFATADAVEKLDGDDLESAALAAAWLGEADACIDFRQRVFAAHIADGKERRAAGVAIELCFDHASRHREAVALGWAQQATRLLEDAEPCTQLGRLAGLRAIIALEVEHDVEAAAEHYDECLRIGRVCHDADVTAEGLAGSGIVLVRKGRVAEGLRLLDESMISAVSGLLGAVMTARVYCNTISMCQALGDIRRGVGMDRAGAGVFVPPGHGRLSRRLPHAPGRDHAPARRLGRG